MAPSKERLSLIQPMPRARKRRWPALLLAIAVLAVVAPVAWYIQLACGLSWADTTAIRRIVADDVRTKGEPILEICKSPDGVAEVVIGVERRPGRDGKGRIVYLQKRKRAWVIVTFSRWSMKYSDTQAPRDFRAP
jgi:hypothetical protein